MSLVGSSVFVVDEDSLPVGVGTSTSQDDDVSSAHNHELVTAYHTIYHDPCDAHPPPTPPGGAEALFMGGLSTSTISASALAQQIHQRHRPFSIAGTSIATDDFQSATDNLHSSLLVEHDNDHINDDTPFGNDALIHTREVVIEEETTDRSIPIMATKTKTESTKTESKPMQVDPAEKIYGTAKGVWAWGKGIIIFSPFMGIAEGIAGKIVQTAGSNMEE